MKKSITLVFLSLSAVVLLGGRFTKNIVDQSITKKAADYLAYTEFPQHDLTLFDSFSYYDLDDDRIADVYVYAKNSTWNGDKSLLLEHIYRNSTILHEYYKEMARLREDELTSQHYPTDFGSLKAKADKCLRIISGYDDFITVITSATKNKMPVWEYKEGLPYDYQVHNIESMFINKNMPLPQDTRIYYNGPAQLFIRDMASKTIINVYNDEIERDIEMLDGYAFNNENQSLEVVEATTQIWDDLETKSIDELMASYDFNDRSSHVISSVPYFRQGVWNNSSSHQLFPAGGSCAVMSTASALFYYDDIYYNMVDLAWKSGSNYQSASAGFSAFPGIGWGNTNPSGQDELAWGPEIALVELAEDLGYNFTLGGTSYNWDNWEIGTQEYTNDRKGLNFSFEKKRDTLLYNPHSFSEISTQMNSDRPMIISLEYFSWGNSPPNAITYIGGHRVCIVAFNDNHSDAGQSIGVYTNGSSFVDYNVVYWNYTNLVAAQTDEYPYTMKITPGGSFGNWIDPPQLVSPADYSTLGQGNVTLTWTSVSPTNTYFISVGTDSNFSNYPYIFQGVVMGTSKILNLTSSGSYYWRVAPYNNYDNVCHFGSTFSFSVTNPTLQITPSSLSFGNVVVNTYSIPQSYLLTGSHLISQVVVQSAVGYLISSSQAGNYVNTLFFEPTNGNLSQTIWVRFQPELVQDYNDYFVCNYSTGADPAYLAVTGSGILNTYSVVILSQIEKIGESQIKLNWDAVPNAYSYQIFSADTPLPLNSTGWIQIAETNNLQYIFNIIHQTQFYHIKALIPIPANFVYVPGGTFTMGDTRGSGTYNLSELPTHSVTISPFYICKYEISQFEYTQIMGSNPSYNYGVGDNYPVYYVSWYATVKYCNLRSIEEGLTPTYSINGSTNPIEWGTVPTSNNSSWNAVISNWSANGYRLPTEAEWEYAARGASTTPDFLYSGSDDINSVAWYSGNNNPNGSKPIGTKAANGLGIFDMSGNVWEWCWDRAGNNYYSVSPSVNPRGPDTGSQRISRGGFWNGISNYRVSYRGDDYPYIIDSGTGFRVCKSAP